MSMRPFGCSMDCGVPSLGADGCARCTCGVTRGRLSPIASPAGIACAARGSSLADCDEPRSSFIRLPPWMADGRNTPSPGGSAMPIPPAVSTLIQYTATGGFTCCACADTAAGNATSTAAPITARFMFSPLNDRIAFIAEWEQPNRRWPDGLPQHIEALFRSARHAYTTALHGARSMRMIWHNDPATG